jgi:splicing factor 3B subunit 1
MSKDYI